MMFKVVITNGAVQDSKKVNAENAEMASKMVNGLINSAWSVVEAVELDEMKEALKQKYYKHVKHKEEVVAVIAEMDELYDELVWKEDNEDEMRKFENQYAFYQEHKKDLNTTMGKMREQFFTPEDLKEMKREYKQMKLMGTI